MFLSSFWISFNKLNSIVFSGIIAFIFLNNIFSSLISFFNDSENFFGFSFWLLLLFSLLFSEISFSFFWLFLLLSIIILFFNSSFITKFSFILSLSSFCSSWILLYIGRIFSIFSSLISISFIILLFILFFLFSSILYSFIDSLVLLFTLLLLFIIILSLDEVFGGDSLFITPLLFFLCSDEFKKSLLFIFNIVFLFILFISFLSVFIMSISWIIFSIFEFISFILFSVIFINSFFIFFNWSTWDIIFSIFFLFSKLPLSINALNSTFFSFISTFWFTIRFLISEYFSSEYFWQLKIALLTNVDELLIILSTFDLRLLFSMINLSFSNFIFEKSKIFCLIYSDIFLNWHPGPIYPVTFKLSLIILSHLVDKYSTSEITFFILISFVIKDCSKLLKDFSIDSILSKFNFCDVNDSKRELLLLFNKLNLLLIDSHNIFVSVYLSFISVVNWFSKRRIFLNISSLNWIKSLWNELLCI